MSATSKAGLGFFRANCLLLLALLLSMQPARAVDTNAAADTSAKAAETSSNAALDLERSYLQFQAAIERNRREMNAAISNSMVLGETLQSMESALAAERGAQLRNMEHSGNMLLISAGAVAAIGIFALVFAAILQWTAVNRMAAAANLSLPRPPAMLTAADSHALAQSNIRFLDVVERLEQRIHELESSVNPPPSLPERLPDDRKANGAPQALSTVQTPPSTTPDKSALINLLFGKSQTLLKLEKPEAALSCLDELLSLDPGNPHALVKKGSVLEYLRRFDEAIQCYDRAIAQDNSMTMAYLCKGGVFNRMERYSEALACYEQALKKPEKNATPPLSPP